MPDSIGEALKIFLEKHLVPTVISVVAAIVALLVLPTDYWMIEKFGKTLFFFLVAGVVFLAIQVFVLLWKGIQHLKHRAYISKEYKEMKIRENQEGLEEWLSFVDKLPPEDRELIRQFLRTNNKPIVERRHVYRAYNPNSIHNTNAIVTTENSDGSRLVKLDDRFYRTMKQIYEDRGSISHFD